MMNVMMKRFCLFAIALTTSFAAMTGAHARDARVHAFACKTFGGVPIDFNFSLQNDSSTEYMNVLCPIPDTSGFPKASIVTVNIHGFDNGGSGMIGVRAHACASAWYTTAGMCTPYKSSGGAIGRDYTITLQSGAGWVWTQNTYSDFGYIHISVPPKNERGVRASFRGIYISEH